MSGTEVWSYARMYPPLREGELLGGTGDERFRDAWALAQWSRADTFAAA